MHPRTLLFLSAATIALVWQLPYGRQLLYPLTAMLVGEQFDQLLLHADGSGVAQPSDSTVMADALGLTYWFWGAVTAAFSLAVAALGIGFVSRQPTLK